MTDHALQLLRAANVALTFVTLLWFLVRIADTATFGRRVLMGGFALLLVAGITGSAIKYLTHAPVDPSIALVTLADVVILIGLWLSRTAPDVVHRTAR